MDSALNSEHGAGTIGDTNPRNTRDQARATENLILYWLSRFGYLTARQVARLVYPQHNQGEAMARRTLFRIERRGLVLRHRGQLGEHGYYGVTLPGARQVYDLFGLPAQSAKDVIRLPSKHRTFANDIAIHFLQTGWDKVWTEREIQTKQAPFRTLGKKIPDAAASDADGYVTWVEVEASRRGGRDLRKLAYWLAYTAFPPITERQLTALDIAGYYYLDKVRFVLAVPQAQTLASRLEHTLADYVVRQDRSPDPKEFASNRLEFQLIDGKLLRGF